MHKKRQENTRTFPLHLILRGIGELSPRFLGIVCVQKTNNRGWHDLLVQLCLGCPCAQVPAAATFVIAFVLDSNFAKMTEDVLHLGIGSGAALTAQVVKPCNFVHQIVNNGNEDLTVND